MKQELLRVLLVASEHLKRAHNTAIDAKRPDIADEVKDAQLTVNDAISLCIVPERKVS